MRRELIVGTSAGEIRVDFTGVPCGRGLYVYALCDPRTGQIRYVGKTTAYLSGRMNAHVRAAIDAPRTHRDNWIRSLIAVGLTPKLVVLEKATVSPKFVGDRERWWISALRRCGCLLTNHTAGGEGLPNPTEETRERLRQRPKPQIGASQRARRSEASKALWRDAEYRARMAQAAAERYSGPSRRDRQMRADSAEFKAWKVENAKRMGALNKGRSKSPEHRAKLAAAARRQHAEGRVPDYWSEERRRKISAGQRAAWRRRKEVVPK